MSIACVGHENFLYAISIYMPVTRSKSKEFSIFLTFHALLLITKSSEDNFRATNK
jgi:peroxiredoxin family protein